jgi:hypothetical protein
VTRIGKNATAVIVLGLLVGGVTSCTADPLAITCGEYMSKTSSEQLDLAARWAAPNRNNVDAAAKMVAPAYRSDLLGYCPTHLNDRLKDLELTIR